MYSKDKRKEFGLIVSFKDFLTYARGDERVREYIATCPEADLSIRELSSKMGRKPALVKKTRILFGYRDKDGSIDLRFITNSRYKRLVQALDSKMYTEIDEKQPSMGEIAEACAHDAYSTPFLLSSSSDLFASDVWVDEFDASYIPDMVVSVVCAVKPFEGNVDDNDRKKREMSMHLMPAGITEGVMSADEICHKGARIANGRGNLDAKQIRDRISLYNSRLNTYRRIVADETYR